MRGEGRWQPIGAEKVMMAASAVLTQNEKKQLVFVETYFVVELPVTAVFTS